MNFSPKVNLEVFLCLKRLITVTRPKIENEGNWRIAGEFCFVW